MWSEEGRCTAYFLFLVSGIQSRLLTQFDEKVKWKKKREKRKSEEASTQAREGDRERDRERERESVSVSVWEWEWVTSGSPGEWKIHARVKNQVIIRRTKTCTPRQHDYHCNCNYNNILKWMIKIHSILSDLLLEWKNMKEWMYPPIPFHFIPFLLSLHSNDWRCWGRSHFTTMHALGEGRWLHAWSDLTPHFFFFFLSFELNCDLQARAQIERKK